MIPLSETIIVALLSLLGSLGGTLGGIALNSKLSNYRIEQLEKKVDKHNNLIERMFKGGGKHQFTGRKSEGRQPQA